MSTCLPLEGLSRHNAHGALTIRAEGSQLFARQSPDSFITSDGDRLTAVHGPDKKITALSAGPSERLERDSIGK